MIFSKLRELTISEFVDILYKGILKRPADPEGHKFYSQLLRARGLSLDSAGDLVEAFVDSEEARNNLFTRDALRFLDILPVYDEIISLGDHCLTSYLLKTYSLKKRSHPFDWLFSSPAMIAHCLDDDFKTFLDDSFYINANERDDFSSDLRTIHSYYRIKFGVNYVFNHHDLTCVEHYSYFLRCIERFRESARSNNNILYLLIYDADAYSFDDVILLSRSLYNFSLNYTFAAVEICSEPTTGILELPNFREYPNKFYHLKYYTKSNLGALRLTDVNEEIGLFRAIKNIIN